MIASIRGEILSRGADHAVIEAGGLGYRVELPAPLAQSIYAGESIFLHTQLIVREDSQTLFGFATVTELEMFNLLLSVNGVGPRSALGVLSTLTPGEIAHAVAAEDDKPFKAVSGIGPKTAKLITVSLAGKLAAFALTDTQAQRIEKVDADAAITAQVTQALVGMGFAEAQAAAAVQDALGAGVAAESAALLRAALQLLQSR